MNGKRDEIFERPHHHATVTERRSDLEMLNYYRKHLASLSEVLAPPPPPLGGQVPAKNIETNRKVERTLPISFYFHTFFQLLQDAKNLSHENHLFPLILITEASLTHNRAVLQQKDERYEGANVLLLKLYSKWFTKTKATRTSSGSSQRCEWQPATSNSALKVEDGSSEPTTPP